VEHYVGIDVSLEFSPFRLIQPEMVGRRIDGSTAEEGPGRNRGASTGALAFPGGLGVVGGNATHIITQRGAEPR